jgi:hypothetical protein
MAASYLIFDFGGNEDAAQQATRRLEAWRKAFRLSDKLTFAFDRGETAGGESPGNSAIHILVCLSFSDHEKLSRQRWLARLQSEEPLKDASPRLIQPGDAAYDATAEEFATLSRGASVKDRNQQPS